MTKSARRLLLLIPVLALIAFGAYRWASTDREELTTLVPEVSAALDEEHPERAPAPLTLDNSGIMQELSAREAVGELGSELPAPAPVAPDVALDSGTSFWCRVEEARAGLPVAGARVSFFSKVGLSYSSGKKGRGANFRSSETDSSGACELRVSGKLQGLARVDADGFAPLLFALAEGHQRSGDALLVKLSRGAELHLTVLDAASKPISGASVELSCEMDSMLQGNNGNWGGEDVLWKAKTGADGRCVLTNLPAAALINAGAWLFGKRLHVELDPLVFESGERREVVWRTGTGATLRGTVHDQYGAAVRRRKLWLARAKAGTPERMYLAAVSKSSVLMSTDSDAEGRFEFVDVPAGDWLVGPAPHTGPRSSPGDTEESIRQRVAAVGTRIAVAEGARVQELRLLAERGLYIDGRVLAPGDSVGNVYGVIGRGEFGVIEAQASFTLVDLKLMTGEHRFRLGPLVDAGHELVAWAMSRGPADSSVRAQPGDVDVVLELAVGAALAGRVIGVAGAKIASRTILVSGADSDYFSMIRGFPGQGFEITGLGAGGYHLVAREADGSVGVLRNVQLHQGERRQGLVITAEPGATLRVVRKAGMERRSVRVHLDGAVVAFGGLVPDSTLDLQVPPGELTVELHRGAERVASRTVLCTAGQRAEVVFEVD